MNRITSSEIQYANVPETLAQQELWLNWRLSETDGTYNNFQSTLKPAKSLIQPIQTIARISIRLAHRLPNTTASD